MTDDELDELCTDCPRLYYMAMRGAWPHILRHGLLSTSRLLDLFGVEGEARHGLESTRRTRSVPISRPDLGTAVVRDQLPMDDAGLRRALPAHIAPSDWYRFLNAKTFFWLTRDRLHRLSTARNYRDHDNEVLILDTRRFVAAHRAAIWLCPINSGTTKPFPAPRDYATFARIDDYDYAALRRRRPRGERIVELCVDGGVADVTPYLLDAYVIRGTDRIGDLL